MLITTTSDLIQKFVSKNVSDMTASEGRLRTETMGGYLAIVNYSTVIALRKENVIYLNVDKYSPTTSKHQNKILRESEKANFIVVKLTQSGLYELL